MTQRTMESVLTNKLCLFLQHDRQPFIIAIKHGSTRCDKQDNKVGVIDMWVDNLMNIEHAVFKLLN